MNKDVFDALVALVVSTDNATARWNVLRRLAHEDVSRQQVVALLSLEQDHRYRPPQDIRDNLWNKLADLSTTVEELCEAFSVMPNSRKWGTKRRELFARAIELAQVPSELGVFVPYL